MAKQQHPTIVQLEATNKAYKLRVESDNDNKLSECLKMSKVTFYTRLKKSNWTDPEILFIEYLSNPNLKALIDSLKILKN